MTGNSDNILTASSSNGYFRQLESFYANAVEFYLDDSRRHSAFARCDPEPIRPSEASVELRDVLHIFQALRKRGTAHLLLAMRDVSRAQVHARVFSAAAKLGFSRIALALSFEQAAELLADAPGWLRACDHILLKGYVSDSHELKSARLAQTLAALKTHTSAVFPVIYGDETLGSHIEQLLSQCDTETTGPLLLGFPLAGIAGQTGERRFIDAPRMRENLVSAKYAWRRMGYPVGLFAFPLCAVSFGEPITEPLIPLIPVFNPFDEALYQPELKPRLNYYSPDGRLPCKCPQLARCPRMHRDSIPLEAGASFIGIRDDYFQCLPEDPESTVLRVTFACNQSCGFCFVEHGHHLPSLAEVRERLNLYRPRTLTISGGEPSLVPALPEFIRAIKDSGVDAVILQTNAVLYAGRRASEQVIESGLDSAFVSLHAHTADLSDSITGLKGSFAKTVAGIENLLRLPGGVRVNVVIHERNYRILPEYVDWLCTRFDARRDGKLSLNIAFVGVFGVLDWQREPDRVRRLLPRLSDVAPYLRDAIERCFAQGLAVGGFETACGVPRCLLGNDPRLFPPHRPMEPEPDFVKPAACGTCRVNASCYGLRRAYVSLYGTDELRPIR